MIPRRLIRTVPAAIDDEAERFWKRFAELHPGWELVTFRDPIDPSDFPLTSPHWDRCRSGAQRAGLVRLEALLRLGGVYVDADVEPYRPFDTLLGVDAFAAWEDENVVPDAVLGAVAGHPAIREVLDVAIERLDLGAWESGPGATTDVFTRRDDVLLLPPGAFYPYHYSRPDLRHHDHAADQPWAFVAHHWASSWQEHEPPGPPIDRDRWPRRRGPGERPGPAPRAAGRAGRSPPAGLARAQAGVGQAGEGLGRLAGRQAATAGQDVVGLEAGHEPQRVERRLRPAARAEAAAVIQPGHHGGQGRRGGRRRGDRAARGARAGAGRGPARSG